MLRTRKKTKSGLILIAALVLVNNAIGQHHYGIGLYAGTCWSFNANKNQHYLGIENKMAFCYEYIPTKSAIGFYCSLELEPQQYTFKLDREMALLLKQNKVNVSLMASLNLKKIKLMSGFLVCAPFYIQTELRYKQANGYYYHSDNFLNSLQKANRFQGELILGMQKFIGKKAKLYWGLYLNQHVNGIITSDLEYVYTNLQNKQEKLVVYKNQNPSAIQIMLGYQLR